MTFTEMRCPVPEDRRRRLAVIYMSYFLGSARTTGKAMG
jgi:hypothetical protein